MKYKKKELLKIVHSLDKINDSIVKSLKQPKRAAIMDALMNCQETAITIGNYLEEYVEGTEHIVHTLEDYCEDIYQMSLLTGDPGQVKKLTKKIQRQLLQMGNQIKYDLPDDKKEIVFLPYKASMWDSLESVWKAAAEDDSCEAYVIPIPYYDKNPDGAFGKMHYEGDQYPDYVPVTSWEEYRIEERRPDIIYIHNPYDQCNLVTSVHPDFYASKLRNYTDLLVYVPYFVGIDDYVEEHFCTTQGVLYAHKVVVQSEKVRKTYIKEIRKFEKEHNCRGVFGNIEEKIIALGSPKYDKVENTKWKNYQMPPEWTKLTERPDGSKKKVILYNTTIESMLTQAEKMIEKIKDVLRLLENNEEIVLLWRPHPLLKATLESMRPDLAEKYLEIEKQYKEAGWGIYDESADLDRAIGVSDAYYGDMSSVVELYKQTGKPIMIQDVEVIYQDAD